MSTDERKTNFLESYGLFSIDGLGSLENILRNCKQAKYLTTKREPRSTETLNKM